MVSNAQSHIACSTYLANKPLHKLFTSLVASVVPVVRASSLECVEKKSFSSLFHD